MSNFDDLVTSRLKPALLRTFGQTVTIIPAEGDSLELTAIHVLGPTQEPERDGEQGLSQRTILRVQISTAAADGWPAAAANGRMQIDGVEWPIERIEHLPGERAVLVGARDENTRRARPGYHGRD